MWRAVGPCRRNSHGSCAKVCGRTPSHSCRTGRSLHVDTQRRFLPPTRIASDEVRHLAGIGTRRVPAPDFFRRAPTAADPRDAALLARMTLAEKVNQLMLLSKGTMTGPDSAGRPNKSAEELAREGIGFQMSAFEWSAPDVEPHPAHRGQGIATRHSGGVRHRHHPRLLDRVPGAARPRRHIRSRRRARRRGDLRARRLLARPALDVRADGRSSRGSTLGPRRRNLRRIAAGQQRLRRRDRSTAFMARWRACPGKPAPVDFGVASCLKHYLGYGAVQGGKDYAYVDLTERTHPRVPSAAVRGRRRGRRTFGDAGLHHRSRRRADVRQPPHASGSPARRARLRRRAGLRLRRHHRDAQTRHRGRRSRRGDPGHAQRHHDRRHGRRRLLRAARARGGGRHGCASPKSIAKCCARWRSSAGSACSKNPTFPRTSRNACALSTEHRAAAREIARKSIVLLKNDANLLPLERRNASSSPARWPTRRTICSARGMRAASAKDVVSVLDRHSRARRRRQTRGTVDLLGRRRSRRRGQRGRRRRREDRRRGRRRPQQRPHHRRGRRTRIDERRSEESRASRSARQPAGARRRAAGHRQTRGRRAASPAARSPYRRSPRTPARWCMRSSPASKVATRSPTCCSATTTRAASSP